MSRTNENEHGPSHAETSAAGLPQDMVATTVEMAPSYEAFAEWLDGELERLEIRFAHYATPSSLRKRGIRRISR